MGYLDKVWEEYKNKKIKQKFTLSVQTFSLNKFPCLTLQRGKYFICDTIENYADFYREVMRIRRINKNVLWQSNSKYGVEGKYLISAMITGRTYPKIIKGTQEVLIYEVPDFVRRPVEVTKNIVITSTVENQNSVKYNCTVVLDNLSEGSMEERYYLVRPNITEIPIATVSYDQNGSVIPWTDETIKTKPIINVNGIGVDLGKGTIITSDSPVGKAILNQKIGYEFAVKVNVKNNEFLVTRYRIKDIIAY